MIASTPLSELDCPSRMFIVSLCLSDADLRAIDFLLDDPPPTVSQATASRIALHRACARVPELAAHVSDLLDVRHMERVLEVRHAQPADLSERARELDAQSGGDVLAGWSWALLTDERTEVSTIGRRLMAECYVASLQRLSSVEGPAARIAVEGGAA